MQTHFPRPDLIGTFHQFGTFGVPYQVVQPMRQTPQGWTVEIKVLETGERLEYSLEPFLNDPEAH